MPKISQLPEALAVNDVDNFIIEQGGETKRAPTTVLTDALNSQIDQALTDTSNAVTQAQSAVSEAQSAVSNLPNLILEKRIYVDALNGSDSNAGSFNDPLKTMEKAFSLQGESVFVKIILLSDVVIDVDTVISGCAFNVSNYLNQNFMITINANIKLIRSVFMFSEWQKLNVTIGDSVDDVFSLSDSILKLGGQYGSGVLMHVNNLTKSKSIYSTDVIDSGVSKVIERGLEVTTETTNFDVQKFKVNNGSSILSVDFLSTYPVDISYVETSGTKTMIGNLAVYS